MADFVFNIARGKIAYYYYAVENSLVVTAAGTPALTSTANSCFQVVAIDAAGETDPALRDYDTLVALLAGTPNEVTNTGYARKVLTDSDLAAVPAPDDTNERYDLDIPDQTWTGVLAGTAWTDLLVCFCPDSTAPTTGVIPLTCHDFPITPDGSDVTVSIAAAGFYRSSG
jgi:hypothetical protein